MDAKDKLGLKMLALMPERVCIGCGGTTKSRSSVCVRCWKFDYPQEKDDDSPMPPALVDEDGPIDPRKDEHGEYLVDA